MYWPFPTLSHRSPLRNLLWLDCTAAAVAGILTIALGDWLSVWYALPPQLLLFIGTVNLLYGTGSFWLARRTERAIGLIKALVYANAAWAGVCLALIAWWWEQASRLGIAHLACEALFVGGLAVAEWGQKGKPTQSRQ